MHTCSTNALQNEKVNLPSFFHIGFHGEVIVLFVLNFRADNMAAIKRFFEKRKLDIKFKKAGEGHSLTSDGGISPQSTTSTSSNQSSTGSPKPPPSTAEQKMAAEAALARMSQKTGLFLNLLSMLCNICL